jgi:hypothetical protein
MWQGLLLFGLLTAGLLCYPRRPRIAGALLVVLGTLSFLLAFQNEARLGALSGLICVGLGASYLIKYRKPDVRAKHVEYWTAKA